MKTIVYDIEIRRCIGRHEGFLSCDGWTDFAGMGISTLGWTRFNQQEPIVCDWHADPIRQARFVEDAASHLVAGFNSRNFDDRVLAANGVSVTTGYDILLEIRRAALGGFKSRKSGYSYTVEKVAQANGLVKSSEDSRNAPKLWQLGEFSRVIDHCRNDVFVEAGLLRLGLAGLLIDPNTKQYLQLRSLADYRQEYEETGA